MIEAVILVALAAILIFVIVDDLRNFRIRNEAVAALAALFVLQTVLRGQYHEAALHAALPPSATGLQLWFSGSISTQARSELTARGWEVHEIP